MSRFLISAAHKSSGKTTISVGLCAALTARGLAVQPFKKGPDYIDPMWLALASGRPCRNLDFYPTGADEIRAMVGRDAEAADVSLVEGNKGLYDGLDLDGSSSNAALARLLDVPVVLVIDVRGTIRGVAPLILGYQAFDRDIRIAGVILNQVGGARHESKLRAVVEHYTDVPVLGAVHQDPRLRIVERHLGLMPSNESEVASRQVAEFGALVGAQVDLERLLQVAREAPPLAWERTALPVPTTAAGERVRIGLVRDRAFGFYYTDDMEALRAAGGELVPVDTLRDRCLPDVHGLIIGGGFPELFMAQLEANVPLRGDIRRAIEGGLPVYAECGGLMYLARSMTWRGKTHDMVGVIPGDVMMHDKPVGRGYVQLRETGNSPWEGIGGKGGEWRAHEFHYSSLENLPQGVEFAYEVLRGHGIDGRHDGIVYKNLLASYTHLRSVGGYDWAGRFAAFVRAKAAQRMDSADRIHRARVAAKP